MEDKIRYLSSGSFAFFKFFFRFHANELIIFAVLLIRQWILSLCWDTVWSWKLLFILPTQVFYFIRLHTCSSAIFLPISFSLACFSKFVFFCPSFNSPFGSHAFELLFLFVKTPTLKYWLIDHILVNKLTLNKAIKYFPILYFHTVTIFCLLNILFVRTKSG